MINFVYEKVFADIIRNSRNNCDIYICHNLWRSCNEYFIKISTKNMATRSCHFVNNLNQIKNLSDQSNNQQKHQNNQQVF